MQTIGEILRDMIAAGKLGPFPQYQECPRPEEPELQEEAREGES